MSAANGPAKPKFSNPAMTIFLVGVCWLVVLSSAIVVYALMAEEMELALEASRVVTIGVGLCLAAALLPSIRRIVIRFGQGIKLKVKRRAPKHRRNKR